MMRECLYEKNVNFDETYRRQKNIITSQIVRAISVNKLNFLYSLIFFKKKLITNYCSLKEKLLTFPQRQLTGQ